RDPRRGEVGPADRPGERARGPEGARGRRADHRRGPGAGGHPPAGPVGPPRGGEPGGRHGAARPNEGRRDDARRRPVRRRRPDPPRERSREDLVDREEEPRGARGTAPRTGSRVGGVAWSSTSRLCSNSRWGPAATYTGW